MWPTWRARRRTWNSPTSSSTCTSPSGASGTVTHGASLLAVYSLGLGVPFLATSLAVDRFFGAFKRVRKYYRMIEILAGLLMIIIGVLLITDRFSILARALQKYLPTF